VIDQIGTQQIATFARQTSRGVLYGTEKQPGLPSLGYHQPVGRRRLLLGGTQLQEQLIAGEFHVLQLV